MTTESPALPCSEIPSSPPSASVRRSPAAIVAAVCLAALVLPLSFSGGALATPAIGAYFHGSPLALNWITNAFMLTFGSCLMAAGTLADRYGRKRIFICGIAGFTLLTLLIALAPGLIALNVLRAVQGLAAAAALAGGSAALAQEFEGHARTRVFSLMGTVFGIGLAFGPLSSGVLIDRFGWRAVFCVPLLFGLASLLLGLRYLRETVNPQASRVDWGGILSFTAMLALLTTGLLEAPARGWSAPVTLALLAAALLSLSLFIAIERRIAEPMLDLRLFRFPAFVGVQLLPVATCFCFVVLLVLLPIRFIGIEGRSPMAAGVLMIALSAPILVMPAVAVWLSGRLPAGLISGVGLLVAGVGLLWLGQVEVGASAAAILPPMLLTGIGAGLPWGLMDGLSVSVVPREQAGMASGIFSTIRVAGEGVSLALVSAALSYLIAASLPPAALHLKTASGMAPAAQGLAIGDMGNALSQGWSALQLQQAYQGAFRSLSEGLALLTIASALAVFWFLRGGTVARS
jgi:MFS family permease